MSAPSLASISTTSEVFAIRAAVGVKHQLRTIRDAARKNRNSAQGVIWRGILKTVKEVLPQATYALSRDHALDDDLRGVYRVKLGRYRLFYLVSAAQRRCTLLLVGYRKAGDQRDAYEEMRRKIRRGEYDAIFAEMGLSKPTLE